MVNNIKQKISIFIDRLLSAIFIGAALLGTYLYFAVNIENKVLGEAIVKGNFNHSNHKPNALLLNNEILIELDSNSSLKKLDIYLNDEIFDVKIIKYSILPNSGIKLIDDYFENSYHKYIVDIPWMQNKYRTEK